MTTKLTGLALLAALLCGGMYVPAVAAPDLSADERQAATSVVSGYLESLISGDISRMRSYLSSEFGQEHATLLSRQDYKQKLQQTYANASYAILGSGRQGDSAGDPWVDARITLASGEAINIRFRLAESSGRYLIVEEH